MSIQASVACILIMLLRLIRKIPRRVISLLWMIPLIRMALPFGVSGKFGIAALINKLFANKAVLGVELFGSDRVTMMNSIRGADSYYPVMIFKSGFPEGLFRVCGSIWAVVSLALIIVVAVIYYVTMREIRDAALIGGRVYISDKVKILAVYGVIKPKIVLPGRTDDDRFILMHEKTHIKRGDNIFRIVALCAVCVHWFNPLCWLFLKMYYEDCELACDEKVLSKLDEDDKKEYARAVLSAGERVSVFVPSFGGARLRVRVENILTFKKMTVISSISFAALIAAVAYFLLTNV